MKPNILPLEECHLLVEATAEPFLCMENEEHKLVLNMIHRGEMWHTAVPLPHSIYQLLMAEFKAFKAKLTNPEEK